ncbi:hypothetical protein CCACVL1_13837 [Corchorus capsularis]|uniref:Uncharacterized protein n=1 Tax=Corchorus capsularis TaxID=210143 RepID=A0A1R3I9E8_COCAP|nr:hypothetical protein CCACVL1_13837 [Corchorus capsularis]
MVPGRSNIIRGASTYGPNYYPAIAKIQKLVKAKIKNHCFSKAIAITNLQQAKPNSVKIMVGAKIAGEALGDD